MFPERRPPDAPPVIAGDPPSRPGSGSSGRRPLDGVGDDEVVGGESSEGKASPPSLQPAGTYPRSTTNTATPGSGLGVQDDVLVSHPTLPYFTLTLQPSYLPAKGWAEK